MTPEELQHDIEELAKEKNAIPVGEWTEEPDRVDFHAHGFACLLHRNRMGAWCGYVGVAPWHPYHGKGYDDIESDYIGGEFIGGVDVHGGLTYAGACEPPLCHIPAPGEVEELWWFGFDLAHAGDKVPVMLKYERDIPDWPESKYDRMDIYRNVAYARMETTQLARQLRRTRRSLFVTHFVRGWFELKEELASVRADWREQAAAA